MVLDLDAIIDQILPWDFSIKVCGGQFATRPLVVADVVLLQNAVTGADKSLDKLRAVVTTFFAAPEPDLSRARTHALMGIVSALLHYWKANAEKNSESISAAVVAEMERLSTPGSSTPPSSPPRAGA